jgi:hypothetical protein
MFGRKKAAGNAGVGIILKVGSDGGLYVKSMQQNGPASNSRVVQVGDLLLEVSGKNAFGKSVDKVKMMILGVPETSCEFLFKRWLHGGDSTIYSIELIRTLAISAEDMNFEGVYDCASFLLEVLHTLLRLTNMLMIMMPKYKCLLTRPKE